MTDAPEPKRARTDRDFVKEWLGGLDPARSPGSPLTAPPAWPTTAAAANPAEEDAPLQWAFRLTYVDGLPREANVGAVCIEVCARARARARASRASQSARA